MSRLQKQIQKLEQQPKNIDPKQVLSILAALGFTRRSGKGSHVGCSHPDLPDIRLTIPYQKPLKAVYVKQILDAIYQLREIQENE